MDKYLKGAKIAYYCTMAVLGIVETFMFGAFYLACTKDKKEETNELDKEHN